MGLFVFQLVLHFTFVFEAGFMWHFCNDVGELYKAHHTPQLKDTLTFTLMEQRFYHLSHCHPL